MADDQSSTTRSFGNMLNQKPIAGKPGKTGQKRPKSPWGMMKKSASGKNSKGC